MLDHITLGVADFARCTAFYDTALAPRGIKRMVDLSAAATGSVVFAGYGDSRPYFSHRGAESPLRWTKAS